MMSAQQQQYPDDEIHIIYNRTTGAIDVKGGREQGTSSLPIQTKEPVSFEAILIYHPGCIWYRGRIIC